MYLIIYEKTNGDILAKVSGTQTLESYCSEFPKNIYDNLSSVYKEDVPDDYKDYKVVNDELVRKAEEEINLPVGPIKSIPSNLELQERIKELENVIDAILGADRNGI